MAAINFPDSPTTGDNFSAGGKTWIYDGATWVLRTNTASKTAYDIAVDNGFVGTEVEWLASLVGDTGATGATGDTGPQGPSGVVGVTSPITNSGTSTSATLGIETSAVVPDQTGNSGKFLTTDGTTSSWGTVDLSSKADVSHTHTVADVTDVTATAAELNVLDGITATTAELNYTDGVTSNIQTQLNSKASTSSLSSYATKIQPSATLTGNHTVTSADDGVLYYCNGTFTVSFPLGTYYNGSRTDFINIGSGVITFAGTNGLTLNSKDSKVTLASLGSAASLVGYSTSEAYLIGDLA